LDDRYASSAVKSFDDVYVAAAATTGDKIPHPLSRKTYKQTLADGTTVDVPEGMVYIPPGEFTMGENESEHKVYLDAYSIGKYEVTNAEWKVFTDITGFTPLPKHWKDGKIPEGKGNHPVVNVSWEDIQKYCEWASKETGHQVRLPTEAQWEKAARGPEGFIFPWGNAWNTDLCNGGGWYLARFGFNPNGTKEDRAKKSSEWRNSDAGKEIIAAGGNTTPVGSFPKGKCFYGCYDMAGNVQEWCQDWFLTDYYKLKDATRNPEGPTEEQAEDSDSSSGKKSKGHAIRGGSWENDHYNAYRCVNRTGRVPSYRVMFFGFRVAVRLAR
jgi:formylglycine-generating enzyme required for sulfatase activity